MRIPSTASRRVGSIPPTRSRAYTWQGDRLTSVNGRKHATSEPKGRADRLWECRQKLLRSATRPFLDSDGQAYAWRRVSLRCNQLMQKAYSASS
jgi:hypothetical protein